MYPSNPRRALGREFVGLVLGVAVPAGLEAAVPLRRDGAGGDPTTASSWGCRRSQIVRSGSSGGQSMRGTRSADASPSNALQSDSV